MRTSKWLIALVAIMATGLIAAGCGDDDESSTTAAETTSTSEETASEDTTTSDTGDSDLATADDVYNAAAVLEPHLEAYIADPQRYQRPPADALALEDTG